MTQIDQFESVFKAADKPRLTLEPVPIRSIVLVTDMDRDAGNLFLNRVRRFLDGVGTLDATWEVLDRSRYSEVKELLEAVHRQSPDLVATYRNLHIPAPDHPYSLGVYVDVLTQATSIPVLLLPNPHVPTDRDFATSGRDAVMAITDHLTGDHHLVSYAARMTAPEGLLYLSHIEDEQNFERYMATIARIPAIDTETAREEILEQLLKEPHDYIGSCREVLKEAGWPLRVEEVIRVGHRLADYRRLLDEHQIDLLVLNTKDEDQLAMHGLAYPLAVEIRRIPLLLL